MTNIIATFRNIEINFMFIYLVIFYVMTYCHKYLFFIKNNSNHKFIDLN